MSEFTEAELKEIEAGVSCGRAFDPATVDRLVKALRLWNERAQTTLREGLALASGLNDSALKLEDAGAEYKRKYEALLLQNRELTERLAEIEKIATAYFDGDQAPMGCVLEVCLRKTEKRKWVGPSDVDPMERTMPVTEKRVEEGQKCAACEEVKQDVLPYCHECYMMT